ncbi:ion channel [Aeoliella sp.]|uniref:ion channel n=1 Tax=Aeoliella sp. TaxID=2795800 RepID=UPI003CCBA992
MLAIVVLISGGLVILTVAIHLVLVRGLSHMVRSMQRFPILAMGTSMSAAIAGHLLEIWLFALALRRMAESGQFGSLTGDVQGSLSDYFYFSALAYTSLGFGDIAPQGTLRTLAAIEAITGLVLIAWTASFAFLAMQELWGRKLPRND